MIKVDGEKSENITSARMSRKRRWSLEVSRETLEASKVYHRGNERHEIERKEVERGDRKVSHPCGGFASGSYWGSRGYSHLARFSVSMIFFVAARWTAIYHGPFPGTAINLRDLFFRRVLYPYVISRMSVFDETYEETPNQLWGAMSHPLSSS